MLLTENQVRIVIRRTIVENNYRLDEKFYRNLHSNLITEGLIDKIKEIPSLFKKAKSGDKKAKKAAMSKIKKSTVLLKVMPLLFMLNTISTGKIPTENNLAPYKQAAQIANKMAKASGGESIADIITPANYTTDELADYIESNSQILRALNMQANGEKLIKLADEVNTDLTDIKNSTDEKINRLEAESDVFFEELAAEVGNYYDDKTGEEYSIEDALSGYDSSSPNAFKGVLTVDDL